MPSLSTTRLPAVQEEPDTGEEAVVVAAIRLPESVEANLRRLGRRGRPRFLGVGSSEESGRK